MKKNSNIKKAKDNVIYLEEIASKSKLTMKDIEKINKKTAQNTKNSIIKQLKPLPEHLRVSITYDNGSENVLHEKVNQVLETNSYFCHPYHSWEKGTVENTNGLIRRFFPKKTDFNEVPDENIQSVEHLLNNRPRKCLNYLTPLEVITNECCT